MATLKKRGKYYYVRWQKIVNGKRREVCKSLKLRHKKLAKDALEKLEKLKQHGEIDPWQPSFDPVQILEELKQGDKELQIHSVRDAADYFYQKKSHLSAASVNNEDPFTMNRGGTYQRVIEYFIKKNDIADLSPLLVRRHHFERVIFRDDIKATTMHFYFRSLRAWWNKLLEWGVVEKDYPANIKKDLPAKRENTREKMLTEPELEQLFKTFDEDLAKKRKQKHWNDSLAQHWFKPLMAVYFYCGLRRNEAAYKKNLPYSGLKYKNLHFEDSEPVILDLSATKGPNERAVPIPRECRKHLNRYLQKRADLLHKRGRSRQKEGELQQNDYIFVYNGTRRKGYPVTGNRAYRQFKRYLEKAGLPASRTIHGMRHQRVTTWLEDGYNTAEAQFMAGHSSVKTTEKYTHLTGKRLLAK